MSILEYIYYIYILGYPDRLCFICHMSTAMHDLQSPWHFPQVAILCLLKWLTSCSISLFIFIYRMPKLSTCRKQLAKLMWIQLKNSFKNCFVKIKSFYSTHQRFTVHSSTLVITWHFEALKCSFYQVHLLRLAPTCSEVLWCFITNSFYLILLQTNLNISIRLDCATILGFVARQ